MKSRKLKVFAFGVIATSVLTLSASAAEVTSLDTLKNCLQSTDETECKLSNADLSISQNDELTVKGTKTLDLNSHALNLGNGGTTDVIKVTKGASLTVTNGTVKKDDQATAGRIIEVKPGGTLSVTSSAIIEGNEAGNYAAIGVVGDGGSQKTTKVDIAGQVTGGVVVVPNTSQTTANNVIVNVTSGAVLKATGNNLAINGAIKSGSGVVINVTGATIESTNGQGIYAAGLGTWNITDATVSGTEAIGIKSGTVNINGGKFTGTGRYVGPNSVTGNTGKTDPTGAAISVTTVTGYAGNINLNITGDVKAESQKGYAIEIGTPNDTGALADVKIESGTFTGAKGGMSVAKDIVTNEKDVVTGGTFQVKDANGNVTPDTSVTAYMADDKVLDENGVVLTNHQITVTEAAEDGTDVAKGSYTITTANGTATETASNSVKDKTVKIGVNLNTGSDVEEYTYVITAKDAEGNDIAVAEDGTFTMPDSAVDVTITYSLKRYDITSDDERVQLGEEGKTAKKGEDVELDIKPDAGYKVGGVTVTPAAAGTAMGEVTVGEDSVSFTMPGCGVSISVTYSAIEYKLTKQETENGSFTISKTSGFVNEEVTVEATPAEGYIVDKITYTYDVEVTDEEGNVTTETKTEEASVVKNTGKFAIPANVGEKAITVNVTFKEGNYDRTISVSETKNGEVKAPTNAQVGDEVSVTVTPAEGYEVDTVVVKTEDGTEVAYKDGKFTMPDGNVTITATFKTATKEPEPGQPSEPDKKPDESNPSDTKPEVNPSILIDNGVSFDGGEEFADGYEFRAVELEKTEDEIKEMSMTGFDFVTAYDLSMLKNGEVVEMVDGSYKISIPVKDLYDTYKVAYIENGKIVEELWQCSIYYNSLK